MRVASSLSKRLRREGWSLRTWVFAVAAVSATGALVTGALAGWYSWDQQKARLDQSLVATTRAIIQAADHELDQAIALARGLSAAPSLERGDLASFERRSRALVEPFGYFLILSEYGSAKQMLNTAVPQGTAYPALPLEWTQGLDEVRGAIVRPLIRRAADGMWTTAVQMVASDAQGRKHVITLGLPFGRFQRIIDEQKLPPQWSPVILDQDWTIVARGLNPEKFIGAKGANPYLMKLPSPDSTYGGRVLEGYTTVNARSRSERFGWTAAVAVPQSLLLQQFLGPAMLAALASFLVCLLALGTIGLLALRVIKDVRVLSKAAEQISERQAVQPGPIHIRELKAVADGMQHASERLKAEEQFRKHAVAELAHRLRNKVATIQAIVYSLLRNQPALRDQVCNRLAALSATDDLLTATHGDGADLAHIVQSELTPYGQSRITADGPQVSLEPNLAFTMALLFHELATNAAKYGALSTEKGMIAIRWALTDHRLDLQWRESGGPLVHKPERRGFGSHLVASALGAFGGEAEAHFEPAGLIVRIQVNRSGERLRVVEKVSPVAITSTAV